MSRAGLTDGLLMTRSRGESDAAPNEDDPFPLRSGRTGILAPGPEAVALRGRVSGTARHRAKGVSPSDEERVIPFGARRRLGP